MVCVMMKGGLGNQMFQYAAGRYLSITNESELYLDITPLMNKSESSPITDHDFGLHQLNVKGKIIGEEESPMMRILRLAKRKIRTVLHKIHPELNVYFGNEYWETEPFIFDPRVRELPGNIRLHGYRQSEQYFEGIEHELRQDFRFPQEVVEKNPRIAEDVQNTTSVALHVRRGDYEHLDWVLPTTYYLKALDALSGMIEDFYVYIFTDDVEYVRTEMLQQLRQESSATFDIRCVSAETGGPLEDLYLMSECTHNVIANSTFSWWGAWLNENDRKLVFAPGRWVGNDVSDLDIYPESWEPVYW